MALDGSFVVLKLSALAVYTLFHPKRGRQFGSCNVNASIYSSAGFDRYRIRSLVGPPHIAFVLLGANSPRPVLFQDPPVAGAAV